MIYGLNKSQWHLKARSKEEFSEFSHLAVRNVLGGQFAVLGIVDFDAVPQEKRNRPFTEPDNPIPLVKFTNLTARPPPPGTSPHGRVSGNDYCPCGSGKKLKSAAGGKEGRAVI